MTKWKIGNKSSTTGQVQVLDDNGLSLFWAFPDAAKKIVDEHNDVLKAALGMREVLKSMNDLVGSCTELQRTVANYSSITKFTKSR